jgi:hypothetical protein
MMTPLVIGSGFLAGMLLGQRFKVLILLPAIGVAAIIATCAGIASGDHFWSIVLLAVWLAVALQIGYLIGTGLWSVLVKGRTFRLNRASSPTPTATTERRPAPL